MLGGLEPRTAFAVGVVTGSVATLLINADQTATSIQRIWNSVQRGYDRIEFSSIMEFTFTCIGIMSVVSLLALLAGRVVIPILQHSMAKI